MKAVIIAIVVIAVVIYTVFALNRQKNKAEAERNRKESLNKINEGKKHQEEKQNLFGENEPRKKE